MRVLVVYESMYGNTHAVANSVAEGLRDKACDVTVVPVGRATEELIRHCDLLVVGGPTHVHGLPRPSTRRAAAEAAEKPDSRLALEPGALGPGLREWLDGLAPLRGIPAAAFDTRMEGPALFTGQASHGIAQRLRRRGYNQAEWLALELGERRGCPVSVCLERAGTAFSQVGRTRLERMEARLQAARG